MTSLENKTKCDICNDYVKQISEYFYSYNKAVGRENRSIEIKKALECGYHFIAHNQVKPCGILKNFKNVMLSKLRSFKLTDPDLMEEFCDKYLDLLKNINITGKCLICDDISMAATHRTSYNHHTTTARFNFASNIRNDPVF